MLKVASGLAGIGSLNYQGTWNASSNVPTLTSSVGTKGYYYLVSVAGSTNLDGITNWQVNDWAVFDGTRWEKVDNNNSVISVNGQTGVVTLAAADVGATPNTAYVVAGTGLSGGGRLTGNVTVNLANTVVTAATYGNATSVSQITVDAQGRITNAANVTISIPGMGTVTNVATGTGLTGGPITTTGTISLANTAVTAGSYGNASSVSTITVNAQGQITAASNTAIAIGVAAVSGAVPNTVNVIAGTNLTGGGALTGNVTINNPYNGTVTNVATGTGLTGGPITSTGTVSLANTAVTAGSYGNASTVGSFTVDAQGRLTSASNSSIAISVSAVSGAVPNTVNVIAGTGLTGGGALTGNVTLSVTANSVNQKVAIQNNGVAVGSEPAINFIPGTSVTITTADDSGNSRSNVTIGLSNNQITLGNTVMSLANTTSTVGNLTLNNVTINSGNVAVTYANAAYQIATGNIAANTSAGVFSYGNLSYSDTGIIASYANSANSYVQIVLQNTSSANNASSDFVVTNDTGSAYADFGVTSSTFVGTGAFYKANTPYLYAGSSDLYIGTISSNAVHFVANNATTDAMVINANNTVTLTALAAGTSSTATFATPSLPLVPAGYLTINLNGTNVKIPYYAV